MQKSHLISTLSAGLLLFFGLTGAGAQTAVPDSQFLPLSIFTSPTPRPRMAPELALATFDQRVDHQLSGLPSYSAVTRISAELPGSKQRAVFELERHYDAPKTLQFVPMQFSGDGFVKHNVINRVLQQEVDRTGKEDGAQTAISERNYKFTYKGESEIEGRAVHVYQVKPRAELPGLFKGHVYLDVLTGALLRAEGKVVKSPSFFIKKIDFVTDYADLNGFSLPIRVHSEADARLIGRVVMDISTTGYSFAGSPASPGPTVAAMDNSPAAATAPAPTLTSSDDNPPVAGNPLILTNSTEQ
ncbi:MAG TPA: hypothetical protein VK699_13905 [Terriglobales bacterium]|jgi:hypothetical protein|nr:hypothetical protein [Terriglobales bacterium]